MNAASRTEGELYCTCNDEYVFNETEARCVVDCENIEYTTGRVDENVCSCDSGFEWN